MTDRGRVFTLRIVGDTKDAQASLDGMKTKSAGFLGGLKGLAAGAAVAGVAVLADKVLQFGADSVQAASDLEQSMGAVDAVFGPASDTIKKFGETAAQSVGLSEAAFAQGTSNIGALLQNMGFDAQAAADQSIALTQVGADLAAQYGGDVTGALDAVNSALKGQFDPLEKYAISLSAAQVQQKAVEMGLVAEGEELTASAKAQATLALVTQQGAKAQGAFGREADTLAGKQARSTAAMENAKATIGKALLPIMATLAGFVGDTLAPVLEDLGPLFSFIAEVATTILKPALSVVGDVIGLLVDLLTGDWEGAWDHALSVVDTFVDTFRGLINAIIQGYNALDWRLDFTVPSWVPGIGGKGIHVSDVFPDIPYLASGGIVRWPTVAMIGEAGPEAVVPLGRGGGLGNTYQITVNAGVGDPVVIGSTVVEMIRAYERSNGTGWRLAP
jgi:hypothetical protein